MDTPNLLAFVAASTVLLLVPGPAVTFVIARSLQGGRAVGLASVVGLHIGTAVHITAAAVGVSALLVSSATAFTVLRWAGAGYLIYLGVRSLIAGEAPPLSEAPTRGPGRARALRQGVVVNVLNPKLAVFFLAYLPQFTVPAAGSVAAQLVVLGLIFVALGLVTDGLYAVGTAAIGTRTGPRSRLMRNRNRIAGITYLGLGALALAFPGRNAS